MKRHEAEQLLELAHDELGGRIPKGHRAHVLNLYAEQFGFEESQMQLGAELEVAPAPVEDHADAPRRESQRHRIIELLATIDVGKAWLAEEIAEQTGFPLNSVSTRMSELVAGRWVDPAGPKRATSHGEPATTYVPTRKTLDHFREEAELALAAA